MAEGYAGTRRLTIGNVSGIELHGTIHMAGTINARDIRVTYDTGHRAGVTVRCGNMSRMRPNHGVGGGGDFCRE